MNLTWSKREAGASRLMQDMSLESWGWGGHKDRGQKGEKGKMASILVDCEPTVNITGGERATTYATEGREKIKTGTDNVGEKKKAGQVRFKNLIAKTGNGKNSSRQSQHMV